MTCKILKVNTPESQPIITMIDYGFAETEGANRKFDDPCEEAEIEGMSVAIYFKYNISNGQLGKRAKFKFTYRDPDGIVKTLTIYRDAGSSVLGKEFYVYSTTYKYTVGNYTNLAVAYNIV